MVVCVRVFYWTRVLCESVDNLVLIVLVCFAMAHFDVVINSTIPSYYYHLSTSFQHHADLVHFLVEDAVAP